QPHSSPLFPYTTLFRSRMVAKDIKPSDILIREAFENAIMANAAIGGSTNFVIHLLAIAGRIGVPLALEDFDKFSTGIPLIANLQDRKSTRLNSSHVKIS